MIVMDTDSTEGMEKGEDNPAFMLEENEKSQETCKNSPNLSGNEEKGLEDEPERQQWSNPIEFLLSCIAMSVR